MAKTIDELRSAAAVVRDATEDGENTALRVGQLLVDMIDTLSNLTGESIKGYVAISNTSELPENPSANQQMIGYMCGSTLYVWVGTGGDTLDGKYRSANLQGPQGPSGADLGEVELINDCTTGGGGAALSAEMGKLIKENFELLVGALGEYDFPNGKPTFNWGPTVAQISLALTNVMSSNTSTSISKGESYSTTLSCSNSSNLYVADVQVLMGGEDITNTAYTPSTGAVSIAEVTGNIVITATQITYIADGLVLHLDGMNRGSTSGRWDSLVNYNDSPLYFTLTDCDESHDSYVAGNGTTSKGVGSVDTLDVSPTSGTIEAVYNGAEWNSDTLAILHNRGSSTVNHIGLTSWHKSESPYTADDNLLTIAMGSKINTSDKVGARFTKNAIVSGGYVSCISNSFRINDATPISGYYEGSTQAADSASMLSIFYRKTSSNERFFKLNLYAIRVYSRQLTDAEREQNKKVDILRFNI